jgi:hypothetical protein
MKALFTQKEKRNNRAGTSKKQLYYYILKWMGNINQ